MNTHFPGCTDVVEGTLDTIGILTAINGKIISHKRIFWTIDSFSIFKSHGIDGIMSNVLELLSNWDIDSALGVNPSKTELVLFTT